MPLVAHSELPAFEALRAEGVIVITPDQAAQSDLAELRVGLLNLMPDAALRATDRQFVRLVSAYGASANLYVYPFTVAAEYRGAAAQAHVRDYYTPFDDLAATGLDALIVTGANPAHVNLADEPFWTPTIDVFDWGRANTQSILCSCLATHMVLKHYDGIERVALPQKRWGVYSHQLLVERHPLLQGLEAPVFAPHSHRYDVSRTTMESAGLQVFAESDEAGVHMATSGDGFSFVFFQGHPEYDGISLLKEYKREVTRMVAGERDEYPPFPEHYFDAYSKNLLLNYKDRLLEALANENQPPQFPEAEVALGRESTWTLDGQAIYRNWLGQVAEAAGLGN